MSRPAPRSRLPRGLGLRLRRLLFGPPRDVTDTKVLQKLSLIAFLAWVGLGADGLSSSAYGPEEAYRQLGEHTYLAVLLAIAVAVTVFVISYTYSRIIEHFPHGGGGYIVATKLLGHHAGVVSGCALLVDYVLTITVSVASGGDAVFSLLPAQYHSYKLWVEFGAIGLLTVLNLRGVKESVLPLVPVFLTFLVTHLVLIGTGVIGHLHEIPTVAHQVHSGFQHGAMQMGKWAMFLLFLRAYSLGGGTYTGIEAVSNGVAIMRDPKVETGKRTMTYMAVSLAFTAGGLIVCYLLTNIQPVAGQTYNATLAHRLFGEFRLGGWPVGDWFAGLTVIAEAVLLLVAAQTGFIDGPRVMGYMAVDNWLPRRFAMLSERLTIQYGVVLMSAAAVAVLAYTGGHIDILVVMYAINVYITFSLSQTGMLRFWVRRRRTDRQWKRNVLIHGVGGVLCVSILGVMLAMKFTEGGWLTVTATIGCVALCVFTRRHYHSVTKSIQQIEETLADLPTEKMSPPPFDPKKPTAIILVGGVAELGQHCLLTVFRLFPESFHNVIFVSIGVVDSDVFKGGDQMEALEKETVKMLAGQVKFATKLGIPAHAAHQIGTDVVEEAAKLCLELSKKHPRAVIFAGEIAFDVPHWYDRLLHNDTAYAIQRRLRFAEIPMMILPVRVRARKSRHALGKTPKPSP